MEIFFFTSFCCRFYPKNAPGSQFLFERAKDRRFLLNRLSTSVFFLSQLFITPQKTWLITLKFYQLLLGSPYIFYAASGLRRIGDQLLFNVKTLPGQDG